ncbi:MAG: hypothetical protein ACRC30_11885 [Clostridium sp.]
MWSERLNKEYMQGYKQGVIQGKCIGLADINYKLLKKMIDIDELRRKVRWLSYYEQKLIFDINTILIVERKKLQEDRNFNLEKELKRKLLEILEGGYVDEESY